jgi:serine/threonine protein kinase
VDLFSYGIVLCEIITRRKISRELQRKPEEAFALNPNELFKLIPKVLTPPRPPPPPLLVLTRDDVAWRLATQDCPEALKQLALKCADYTPENRPSFLTILDILADIEKELREGTTQTAGGAPLAPEPSTPKPEIWAPAVYEPPSSVRSFGVYIDVFRLADLCLGCRSKRFNIDRSDRREASATIEKTKLALAPKTQFEVMRFAVNR